MADNPFGSPVAGLALEMAVRNQQLLERMPAMTENQRRLLNMRLQKYGGDLSQYESVMQAGYEPTVSAMRSQAESMRDYLVGLPELMATAAKEGRMSTGGGESMVPDTSDYWQNYDRLARMMREGVESKAAAPGFGTADTQSAWSQYNQPPVAPKPTTTTRRLRPVRGNF